MIPSIAELGDYLTSGNLLILFLLVLAITGICGLWFKRGKWK